MGTAFLFEFTCTQSSDVTNANACAFLFKRSWIYELWFTIDSMVSICDFRSCAHQTVSVRLAVNCFRAPTFPCGLYSCHICVMSNVFHWFLVILTGVSSVSQGSGIRVVGRRTPNPLSKTL